MLTDDFINQLRIRLAGIPKNDLENTIDFYKEIIEDKKDEGISDEQILNEFDSIDSIVNKILDDYNIGDLVNEKIKSKTSKLSIKYKTLIILLLILSSPITIPLLIALFSAILSIIFAIITIIITIYLIFLLVPFTVLTGSVSIVFYIVQGNILNALYSFGIVCVALGLLLLLFTLFININKYIFRFIVRIVNKTKKMLVKGSV